jgi:hypothetical protein
MVSRIAKQGNRKGMIGYGLLKVHGEPMFCHFFNAKGAKFAKKKEIFAVFAGFAVRSLTLRKPCMIGREAHESES